MKTREDIIGLSIPFVTGVAVAALADFPSATAAFSLVMAGLMFGVCAGKSVKSSAEMILFLCLGAFCWSSAALFPITHQSAAPSQPLLRLMRHIESLPFRHKETGALLEALLAGRRETMDKVTVAMFREAGAAHILALSGLHLGIIYIIISFLLKVLGNSRAAFIMRSCTIAALTLAYTVITGASPSIVRAFLFICFTELSRHFPGRRKTPISVWCSALLLQLTISPRIITSTGFQLSYMAMLGIFTLFPKMKAWYPASGGKPDPVHRMWDSMALAISCQAYTAPIVWFQFHTFPKYFLLTNLIALPLTEALMTCAIAAMLFSPLRPQFLYKITDMLATALQRSLEVISEM